MRCTIKLPYIHHITFVFQNCGFVVVYVEVVGSGEDSHYGGEAGGFGFAVHAVSVSTTSYCVSSSGRKGREECTQRPELHEHE